MPKFLGSLFLLILLVCGLVSITCVPFGTAQSAQTESQNAQSLPMPQFTVRYIVESFNASTSPSIDPYTGESIPPTNYQVDLRHIQVAIKNDLPEIPAGSHSEYYYNVRSKGQFTEDWTEAKTAAYGYYRPSDSPYTLINYSLSSFSIIGKDLPVGTKIDFQVILMYGGIGKDLFQGPLGPEYFVGETSGWSTTKTVTIGDTSTPTETTQATQTPTPEPTQTQTATNSITAYPAQSGTQQGFESGNAWQTVVIVVLAITVILLVMAVVLLSKRIA